MLVEVVASINLARSHLWPITASSSFAYLEFMEQSFMLLRFQEINYACTVYFLSKGGE